MGHARRRAGARRSVGAVSPLKASGPAEREAVEIGAFGLHREALDEEVSVEGLIAGRRDRTARKPKAA